MKKIYLIGILILLSSCVTSKITSNKLPGFDEKISKLFILVKGSDSSKSFFQSFVFSLRKELNEKNVELRSHYFSPLSLETENDVEIKISDFGPNLIMSINQTESRQTINTNGFGNNAFGWGFNNGYNSGGTFDVKIFQPNSKKPVWRANLKADGQMGLEGAAEKAVEKLIEKLIEDKLL
tara:strand:- start:80 stop:619 length:540 start_codon:yes stop_codon:yes gene_type:complete